MNKILLVLSVLLLFGCKKYEEGPSISFRTKKARLTNAWNIERKVFPNGTEEVLSEEDKNKLTEFFLMMSDIRIGMKHPFC